MSSKNLHSGSKLSKGTVYTILGLSLIIFLVILYLLLGAFGINPLAFMENGGDAIVNLPDQCSIIAGQMIHTINLADECSLKCRSECEVLEMNYDRDEFSFGNQSCNSCTCFCG